MNGMTRKKLRRRDETKYTPDGLPLNANDWTVDDWRDLWTAMEFVRVRVSRRHAANRAAALAAFEKEST